MTEQMDGQVNLFAPDTWSGRMSPEHSAVTKAKTSPQSSKKRSGLSSRKPPMCLCLKKDGQPQEWSWETDGALLGVYSMLNFGESPNAAVVSHLSQILEDNPHPKYYLSAKACQGILNRAERRGKDLPPEPKKALMEQATLTACKEMELTEPIPLDATDLVVGVDCYNQTITGDVSPTLRAIKSDPDHIPCIQQKRVRRLTPLECERLQGYPDGWTNIGTWMDSKGKKHESSDAARYKALGNSIALPPWKWVLKRLCAQYERDATMASLFDGIGGFPRIWEQLNGEGSCLWASEVEPFCVAVTERRFAHE